MKKLLRASILAGSVGVLGAAVGIACGGADGSIPDGGSNDDGSGGDSATGSDAVAVDGGNDTGSDVGVDADAGPCPSTSPTGNACAFGACYCGAQPAACYAASIATKCCDRAVVCATPDGGGNPDGGQCVVKHPIVDGGARYCNPGDCYCAMPDNCYPQAVAATCCKASSVTCY